MKTITLVLLTLTMAVALFAQAAGEKIVASVNDNIQITLEELQAEIRTIPQENLEIATTKEGVDQILDQVIRRKLLALKAREMEMDTVTIVKKAVANSEESILADFLLIQLRQSTQLVTPEQAQQFYTENESLFYSAPTLELKQIVVATADDAVKVEKDLKGGDFDGLMAKYPGITDGARSGDLGIIPVNQLATNVFDAIGSLDAGEWAGPIQTGSGYHFIMVVAKAPSKKVVFEEISENLQQQLTANVANQNVTAYIQELEDNASITRNNAAIKDAILTPSPAPGN